MTFASDTLCTAGLAAFAAAVFGGGFYLLTYRPYAKKKRAAAAAEARAGGLAALGQSEQRTPEAAVPAAPRPHAHAH